MSTKNWQANLRRQLAALPDATPEGIKASRGTRTREECAEMLGVAYRTFQDWELGSAKMPRAAWELLHVKFQIAPAAKA